MAKYGAPTLDCDLVMKGGITSGVVYPLAICSLAENYRLHSIGGASAGAIAAATAAAAEYARQHGRCDGYERLEELPLEISADTPGGRTRLLSLFQPAPSTKTAFDAFLVAVGKSSAAAKGARLAWLISRRHPVFPVVGLGFAIALVIAAAGSIPVTIAASVVGVFTVVAGIVGGVVVASTRAYRAIASNRGGICSGHAAEPPEGEPALCEWLADLLDDIAGTSHDKPLTFGDLRSKDIELAMITTSLTHGRPHRLPFADDAGFFFKKSEIRALFPARIADALETAGYASLVKGEGILAKTFEDNGGRAGDYVPLPPSDKVPVVFGVRLSLSFPVLLSAIPLHAVDWTSVRHPDLDKDKPETKSTRPTKEYPAPGAFILKPCWFSDGGICSNLPIHFFDSLLPRWPTFALNLRLEHEHYRVWVADSNEPGSEDDNVWIPESPNAGFSESWDHTTTPGLITVVELFKAMINTMQNWNDNMLAKAPGYRDRIVHISHRKDEGGMNLEMPPGHITRLSQRGAAAGHKVGRRFDRTEANTGWDDHLRTRYRTSLGMLQGLLAKTHERYFADQCNRQKLDTLVSAAFDTQPERDQARKVNDAFGTFTGFANGVDFGERVPRPITDLRPRPRGS